MKRLHPHLEVALLYATIATIATWPLAAHLGTHFPSSIVWFGGDPNIFIWWIDWSAKALLGQLPVAAGKMLYWPVGIDPLAGWDGPIMLLVGVPIRLLTGNPILAYNGIVFAAFIATAFSAYLLTLHLTRSRYASVFGGVLFGFSSFMMVRMTQHANLVMLFAVPLLALATIRFCEKPSRRSALWLGAAVFLAAVSSWYYLITGALFIAMAFIAFRETLWKKRAALLIACLAMAAAAVIPALPPLLSPTHGGQTASLEFIRDGRAMPLNFILPHPYTNIFGQLTKGVYDAFPRAQWTFEHSSYFGIVVLTCILIWCVRRKKIGVPYGGLWAATFAVFIVLAMGIDLPVAGTNVPLPFALLAKIFPFSRLRVPNRMFVWALLAGVVVACVVIARLRAKAKTPVLRIALTVLLAAGIAADQVIFPYPIVALTVPDFYRQIAKDGQTYALAELPIIYPGFSEYDYFQTIHGKPITEAEFFYTAYSDATFSYIKNNPLLAGSVCQERALAAGMPDKDAVFADFRANNVRYVVVHNLLLHNTPHCDRVRVLIRSFFAGEKHVFADGEITVYEVPPLTR